ncbi:RDD family protein [Haloglomus litoreum]|uniref:RDD family protein n=1 Tax=Haloglomus litoreum TaxID=3034026 RepID=UPI0023E7A4CF|nr:RDD family protein [Haloglomus sp. DT116]
MASTDEDDRCGVGIRGVAMAIDSGVWFALLFVAVYAVAAATGQIETVANGTDANLEGGPAAAALALWLGLAVGYHTVCEWRFGGTIGKRLVRIRVESTDGSPLSLGASLLRNLARLVDWLPFGYALGIVVVLSSDEPQRLGDRLGGTVVVRR